MLEVKPKDIDELICSKGRESFAMALSKAKSYTMYKIDSILSKVNYKTIEEKKRFVYQIKPHLLAMPLVDRNQYITLIAEQLMYPRCDVQMMLKDRYRETLSIKKSEDRHITAQKHILSTLFSGFSLTFCLTYIQQHHIELTPEFKGIFDYIVDKVMSGASIEVIGEHCLLDLDKNLITDIIFKSDEVKWEQEEQVRIFIDQNFKYLIPYWNLQALRESRNKLNLDTSK